MAFMPVLSYEEALNIVLDLWSAIEDLPVEETDRLFILFQVTTGEF